jgi:uncharacterized membrane protein YfcA
VIEVADIATVFSGSLVGFVLGLIGGGGSILKSGFLVSCHCGLALSS